ncbi:MULTISPECIES: Lrp/AsnC family transcriptional regulator [Streptomyces]|uniref:DNA-binding transcriptional regulator AsnC n=1 Tax=Streptomyces chartreusis NRRL 3882 TaxID=1079985 RepID=A0A2N9BJG1_STRCX|nr:MULTISPECIES: Lrp/AsnC family transcriptional regulator [Streptomyces]MYS92100.1 AsnC family transcriptional regulator [Streptomyces sp. SID5464]SOR83517.1 DNA-binding transcriptional regulator AsnC [Streptomyces chartreusis NRRL 3882]
MENALDDDDLDLVAALQRAPRAPLSLLAQALGVSASTVGRRLARLESNRLLRVIGQVDLSVTGEGTPWHVWVAAAPGRALDVARGLVELPEAAHVAVTAGQADVYCVVQPARRAEARDLLTRHIATLPGVRSTRTELVLRADTKSDAWRLPRLTQDQHRLLATYTAEERETDPGGADRPARPTGDELRILRLLAADGRMTAAQASRELGIGQSTAYRVTQSLLQRGLVRPRVEIEPGLLGYALEAVVALTVAPGGVREAARTLARHPSARYVSTNAGTFSVVHQGVFRDEEGLAEFLTRDLAELDGVISFDVSVVLQALRRHWLDREDGRLAALPGPTDTGSGRHDDT